MNKKTIGNIAIATTAFGISHAYAAAPSTDPRYEGLREIMRDYVEGVVQSECTGQEGFDVNSYQWDNYEIKGLEVVLFDILNHTANYCKPPELTGMHAAQRKVGDRTEN